MRIKDAGAAHAVFGSPHGAPVHAELAGLVASTGALLSGHFRLQSGLHTPYFLRFGQLAYEPAVASRIAELCASAILERSEVTVGRHLRGAVSLSPSAGVGMPSRSGATDVIASTARRSVVLCAETSARLLGTALAEAIGAELAIAEVDERRQPRPALLSGTLEGRREVVVVTDVVTTGRSIAPLVEMARAAAPRVRLVAFACLDPRGLRGALAQLRVEGGCLLEGRWTSYAASDCALCREGVELVPAYEFN